MYRVVEGRVHLRGDYSLNKVEGVIDDAVNLRNTSQCVGILHSVALLVALCINEEPPLIKIIKITLGCYI